MAEFLRAKGHKIISKSPSGGGASGPFTPASLPLLKMWLDASDATTINSGTPVNNDLVTTWTDKSPNAYVWTGTGSEKPTYKTGLLNSLPGISFQSGSRLINSGATFIGTGAQAFTIWIVFITPTLGGNPYFFFNDFYTGVAGSGVEFTLSRSGQYNFYGWFGASNAGVFPVIKWTASFNTSTKPYILTLTYNGGSSAPGSYVMYSNNVSQTIAAGGDDTNSNAQSTLGGCNGTNYPLQGSIHEYVISSSVLSTANLTALNTYATTKWGTFTP